MINAVKIVITVALLLIAVWVSRHKATDNRAARIFGYFAAAGYLAVILDVWRD